MPRRTRTRHGRPLYSDDHKNHLLCGHDFFGGGFGTGANFREDDAAEAWEVLREELLWEHISEKPCTRPWAWWHFEDREPRLCIESVREPEADDADEGEEEEEEEEEEEDNMHRYGCRSPWYGREGDDLHFESQAHYLRRYRLLTKAERDYLERHPERLEPVLGHRGNTD
jgi:hypothetical protein